ncbi:MAG: alpha/beta fold hydrolase [Enhydrobacter sp.]|nr:MAG: alpha/beta fold hydrolase [Enhydrobacter sp.]
MKRILTFLVLLTGMAVAAAAWVGLPYLEHRWTYHVLREAADGPWARPAGAEKVSFRTAGDVRLRGWFFKAAAPRNGVTVLVLAGNFGHLPSYVPHSQFLQRRGFDLLLFNYRGFGMSDGETESEATLTRDAEAAMRYLAHRGIDPSSVAIVGVSLGAPVAATLAARTPCRAVALVSTVASAKDKALLDRPWLPAFVLDHLTSPFDAAGAIDRARCPVLVVHGSDDESVPLDQAVQVFDAAHAPKRLVVVPTAEHNLLNVPPEDYLDAMASFFLKRR